MDSPQSPMSQASSISIQNFNMEELKTSISHDLSFEMKPDMIHELLARSFTWRLDLENLPIVLRELMRSVATQKILNCHKKEVVTLVIQHTILNQCCSEHLKKEMIEFVKETIDVYYRLGKGDMIFEPKKKIYFVPPSEECQYSANVQKVRAHLRFEVESSIISQLISCGDGYKLSLLTLPLVLKAVMCKMTELRNTMNLVKEQLEELVVQVMKVLIIDAIPDVGQQSPLLCLLHNLIRVYYGLSKGANPFKVTISGEACCLLM